jgi:hypothetical protein
LTQGACYQLLYLYLGEKGGVRIAFSAAGFEKKLRNKFPDFVLML